MDLLAEIQAELRSAQERPEASSHAVAVRDIAAELEMPIAEVKAVLATLEAQPRAVREKLLCRVAEAWLETQRRAYRIRRET